MIRVYQSKKSDRRFRQVIFWLISHRLEYQIITKRELTKEVVKQLLFLSEAGFEELLISEKRRRKECKTIVDGLDLESMRMTEMIDLIVEHPSLLKGPITFDENHLLIGYNEEEIRQFIPQYHRKLRLTVKGYGFER